LRWSTPTGLENAPPSQVTGLGLSGQNPRLKDKVTVLERDKKLKVMYIFVKEDYLEAVRQNRK
jgi:hypothetical protein